ncbi:pentapeptide repeat-containing protein [Leptothermofonsia sichuanensis]|uniref:pentapeptide repeat-containing protein n=1 Tax=Leptothermofonsia sichuanensis TaxID=2917832 RepID=UPI001CECAB1B|nr:pentapeptide repeat-containing protein [Leptothermofonsia sichuanensis]
MSRKLSACLLLFIVWTVFSFTHLVPPVLAAIAQPDLTPLTLEVLQQRLKSPIANEGIKVIDLQRLNIDLRPENAEFRDRFYDLLKTQLQRPGTPVGLDLSYSQIQGEFKISQLGLRAPLFGESLSPIFTPAEQEQLQRDRRRLSRLSTLSQSLLSTPNLGTQTAPLQITVFRGPLKLNQTRFLDLVDFTNTFFLNRVEAQGSQFTQGIDSTQTRFSQTTSFAGALFERDSRFRSNIFFGKAEFNQAQFWGPVTFQNTEFQATANFNLAVFQQPSNFMRVQWQGNADFARALWQADAVFTKSTFSKALFLPDAVFEKAALFRQTQFNKPVNMRGTSILEQADFSDAGFARGAYLNVPGLKFDSEQAKIVGDPGQIGRFISVPTLQGNENLLRELVRNFRRQEQIPDANQMDYTRQRLRLRELRQQLFGININTAPITQLQNLGFSQEQATAIAQRRAQLPFRSLTDLLSLAKVDIATYINVRDRVVAKEPVAPGRGVFNRILIGLDCIGLSLLLLLSHYGTRSWLIFGVGLITIAYFGVLFWFIDRSRRLTPKPILPTLAETLWMLAGFSTLFLLGLIAIFRNSDQPWLTLASLAAIDIPVPTILIALLYKAGRYHPLMDVSYFMEEGTLRQLRILVGRLPIIPRYQMFRERYIPILWNRRWNWLNYFDFSFNNLLRFGFNDIRLRDEHVPGLITALVWYQWAIGILYLALLFWTLSRTIPGLNLLIYFK